MDQQNTWLLSNLGLTPFDKCHRLQLGLLEARRTGAFKRDLILLLEHPPVYTVGRRGGRQNLIVDEATLRLKGIDLVAIERGGDITYHGPGQSVGYLLVDLKSRGMDIPRFVRSIEEVMIRTARDFSVGAERDPRNPGIWVNGEKLGSIGIAIRYGITFHGFALNVDMDLTPFQWIHPCGMAGVSVTSLSAVTNSGIEMKDVQARLGSHLQDVFQIQFVKITPESLYPAALQNTSTLDR